MYIYGIEKTYLVPQCFSSLSNFAYWWINEVSHCAIKLTFMVIGAEPISVKVPCERVARMPELKVCCY